MRELIILIVIGMIIYYTYKYVTGTLVVLTVGVVALYISYLIYTQVIFGVVPDSINLPERFKDNDIKIEEIKDDYRQYEYR